MSTPLQTAIQPTRAQDYPEWYQQVIKASDMAENSPVRGCMVIKPWGFALWENITRIVDDRLKAVGVRNAYFPIFIPLSFLQKEAQHVEGFAKECAVVTHHRLEKGADGQLVPAGVLNEPLIVRPTSETIIGDSFSRWVKSYRDLPILINQWGNVVRWELRTRIFLRTSEFLWQEGHTVHATADDAMRLTETILDIYVKLAEQYLAMPVIAGKKSPAERFPGADETLTIEAMMQDRKALQAGTSHFLGQNFARAQEIKFQNADEQEEYAWTTSWAVSTRLLGGLIMTHGDDDGAILPPRVASAHLVLMPIVRKAADQGPVMDYVHNLARELRAVDYHGQPLRVEIDARDIGGARGWEWIKKGIPLRLEIGPRDVAAEGVYFARRDKGHREKAAMARARFVAEVGTILDDIQRSLYDRALSFQETHTRVIDDPQQFQAFFTPQDAAHPDIHGGFALSHWCGGGPCEAKIKADLGVTIRCLPFDTRRFVVEPGVCIGCGQPSARRVIFAKAY